MRQPGYAPPDTRHASGTRDLSDAAFVAAFEGLTLDADRFRHYDHVRIAWIFLREATGEARLATATARMAAGIRRFAVHHAGSLAKYHETTTRAFVRLVAAHWHETPTIEIFEAFADAHPRLFDKRLLLGYFSKSLLESDAARHAWVEPDLRPLP